MLDPDDVDRLDGDVHDHDARCPCFVCRREREDSGQSPDRAPTEPHDPAADCWCEACVDADRGTEPDDDPCTGARGCRCGSCRFEEEPGGPVEPARHVIGCGCPDCPPPLAGDGLGASRR